SLKLALDWIVYEEWRYCYAEFILNAIVFEASDELLRVVKEEIGRLPGKVGEILAKCCKHVMYRYNENNIERTNQERYSLLSTEDSATSSIRSSTPSMRSFAYSEIKTSSMTQDSPQPPSWSSETENLLLSACSSTSIFDEFLLDDSTQQTNTPNNTKSLIPLIHSTNLISHEKAMKRQQANSSQQLAERNGKYSQKSKISHQSRNERNSRVSNKSQRNYSEVVTQEVAKETIISEIANNEDQLSGNEPESGFEEVLLLNQSALSKIEALSCFDEPPFHFFPNYINIDYSWEKEQSEMMRGQKIAQKQELTKKLGCLNKFGFVADANLSDNAITV
ncbi:unnamed protein product, partial [Onchocerca ochengi]|uniref:CLASP_N domain-containing protein n=1 Tax=Onchocerca ochengi TaxID=42157 RepID=A0A182EUU3_ONCOC